MNSKLRRLFPLLGILVLTLLSGGVAHAGGTKYEVSGAGTAEVNGIYTQVANGSWGGAVYLMGNKQICADNRTPTFWYIADYPGDCGSNPTLYYMNQSTSATPPASGWGMGWGSGMPPNPTVSLSSGGGVWSEPGCGVNGTVTAMLHSADNNDLYIGGWTFDEVGCSGMAARSVARWNKPTSTWYVLGPGLLDGGAYAVAQIGADVYYGGDFTQLGDGTIVNYIARWNTTTSSWSPIIVGGIRGVSARVMSLAASGTDLYVGGDFQTAGGATVNCIARYDTANNTWNTMGPNPGANWSCSVRAIAVSDDGNSVYAGGKNTMFLTTGPIGRNIARWNKVGNTWTAFQDTPTGNAGLNTLADEVWHIAVKGSDIYVAGKFDGSPNHGVGAKTNANNIAKWNFGNPYGAWTLLGDDTNANNGRAAGFMTSPSAPATSSTRPVSTLRPTRQPSPNRTGSR